MRIPRQARLESAIILALVDGEIDSIAELSRRVDASRPSTSRAFAALKKKGFVETTGRRRSLTEEGRMAVGDLLVPSVSAQRAMDAEQRKIWAMVERAQVKHFLGNTAVLDMMRMFDRNQDSISKFVEGPAAAFRLSGAARPNNIAAKFAELAKVSDAPKLTIGKHFAELGLDSIKMANIAATLPDSGIPSVLADISKRFADMPIPTSMFADLSISVSRETREAFTRIGGQVVDRDLTDFIAKTSLLGREVAAAQLLDRGAGLAAAMDSIRLQMDALGPAMLGRDTWVPLITENLVVNTRIARDMFAIAEFANFPDARVRKRHSRVAAAIDPVIEANRDHTAAELGRINEFPGERANLVIPSSLATSRLAGVARLLLDGHEPQEEAELPEPGELFDLLDVRGMSAAIRDLRGARDALVDLRHGWAKTCAHLLREAFREVLAVLAPDDEIPNPTKVRVTRRMRINYAVGSGSETLTSLADSSATGWDGIVAFLSSEAHRDGEPRLDRAGMVGVLVAVEGTIRILIAAHDIGKNWPD